LRSGYENRGFRAVKKMFGMCWAFLCCCGLLAQVSPQVGIRTFQAPEYPAVARQARIQGEVHLQVMVNADGKIASVEASSGPEILVAQAKSNITQWSYTPTGQPI
jgi:TonB family protein